MSTKTWDKESIQELLKSNDKAVARAVLAVYRFQTEAEKSTQTTRDSNGIGFSAFDAEILSDFAEKLKRGLTLSPRQLELARKKMLKYHRQLVLIANKAVPT